MRSSSSETSWGCSGSSSKSCKHVIYFFTVIQSAGPSSSSSLSSPKASNALFNISYLVYFNIRSFVADSLSMPSICNKNCVVEPFKINVRNTMPPVKNTNIVPIAGFR
uniref:Uncharacterized protein n=1 Tax=Arundo donax TaxID=35708 RepID=A0A0A9DHD8_ARUDO